MTMHTQQKNRRLL